LKNREKWVPALAESVQRKVPTMPNKSVEQIDQLISELHQTLVDQHGSVRKKYKSEIVEASA